MAQALAQQLAGGALLFRALSPWAILTVTTHRLILVLGDQLDRNSAALADCDKGRDRVLMIESREESQRVWSHKARSGLFLAAMRHHRDWLRNQGFKVDYIRIDEQRGRDVSTARSGRHCSNMA